MALGPNQNHDCAGAVQCDGMLKLSDCYAPLQGANISARGILWGHFWLQFFLAPSLATEGAERSTIGAFSDVQYDKVRKTLHVYSLNQHFKG